MLNWLKRERMYVLLWMMAVALTAIEIIDLKQEGLHLDRWVPFVMSAAVVGGIFALKAMDRITERRLRRERNEP